MEKHHPLANKEMTLLDLLDGIIDTGVAARGEILISIANIDLIVIDLRLLISSIESAYGPSKGKIIKEVMEDGTIAPGFESGGARAGEIGSDDY